MPLSRQVFNDALGGLLVEQDAYWQRSNLTSLPQLCGEFAKCTPSHETLAANRVVLGFSGGKDSIVSLFALLKAGYEVTPLLLNEGDRTWQDLRKWIVKLERFGLEPMVAYLSAGKRKSLRDRYGDWYFSSYQLGWLTSTLALCAVGTGSQIICLGIESSADFSFTTVSGRRINHQYQKTTRHLKLLERFYQSVLHSDLRIASPIAGATDAEVLKVLLTQVPRRFRGFSSCGASNSRSKHCGACVKCAFVYALLFASDAGRQLSERIFRRDLLEDLDLYRPWLDQRFRMPPGCVGSRLEVWDVLEALLQNKQEKAVVKKWKGSKLREVYKGEAARRIHTRAKSVAPLSIPVSDAAELVRNWISE
jgi:7-cyano-7-deazaguanine synthase in queuosine biosynthesis